MSDSAATAPATMERFLRLNGPVAKGPVMLFGAAEDATMDEDISFGGGDDEAEEEDPELSAMVDDECNSDESHSDGEREAIDADITELHNTIPGLVDRYPLIDKLGEGTFSSVYKAIDRHHECYDNRQWAVQIDDRPADEDSFEDVPRPTHVYLAVKRIYVTASPQRILNELEILESLRGARHTSFLVAALRHEDQVLAVMPYQKHQDFRSYYRGASLDTMRQYFGCLFAALADSHARDIIHRDVKPANFLFNYVTGQGTLCDFGLAERVDWLEWHATCLHSLPCAASGRPHGVRLDRPISVLEQLEDRKSRFEARPHEFRHSPDGEPWLPPAIGSDEWRQLVEAKRMMPHWEMPKAPPKSGQRVGFLKDSLDRRPTIRANRAGTRGFRAPEVLLKCQDQTVALDVWSVGIILLCFLTRRFPFFNSNDDIEALMELAALLGSHRIAKCAVIHNRSFQTNVPNAETPDKPTLHEVVRSLNPTLYATHASKPGGYEKSELHQAVDLMRRCLATDHTRRITAAAALEHPFLRRVLPA